jgi:hypothetical protein
MAAAVSPTLDSSHLAQGTDQTLASAAQASDAQPVRDLSAAERAEVDERRDEHSAGRGMSLGAPKNADREMMWPDR